MIMTREEYAELTDEEKRIKIAKLCRWKKSTYAAWAKCPPFPGWDDPETCSCWISPDGNAYNYCVQYLPDYLNDLNAMHKAEMTMTARQMDTFDSILTRICRQSDEDHVWSEAIHVTAAQRAEAFVLTMTEED